MNKSTILGIDMHKENSGGSMSFIGCEMSDWPLKYKGPSLQGTYEH